MTFGKMSWLGTLLALLGWGVLLGGDWALAAAKLWADPITVAAAGLGLIASGIGLAVVDALNRGFGVLNGFFEQVLQRSAARANAASPAPPQAPRREPAPPPQPAQASPAGAAEIVERGRFKDRAYLLYADGSVEVETLLGVRRFASIAEAKEFIGS